MTKAETAYIERLRGALTWIEEPFVTEQTPASEMWARIRLVREDVLRAERALEAATRKKIAP